VHHVESLSMSWCLDCHRAPEDHVVPKDKIYDLAYVQEELKARREGSPMTPAAAAVLDAIQKAPPENCGACHY
jgi:hypothetical protein